MHALFRLALVAMLCQAAATGCARSTSHPTTGAPSGKFRLAAEPAGAIDVIEVREQAQDGQPVVVLGRLGGGAKPWIDGRAAFLLVDERIAALGADEECDENCPHCVEALAESSTMVKFLGDDGKVLPVDARELLGLGDQQTVVIRGIARRDKGGNVTIAAEGIFVRR
jgi:hypothetical protein